MYNPLIYGRDIIIVGQQPWDIEIGSNCKNIALEFSKNNRVLYVNSPLDRNTRLKGKDDPRVEKRINVIDGKEDGLVKLGPNLWNLYPDVLVESINWIPNAFIFDQLNKRNNRLFARSIKKAMYRLGLTDILLFNDNEMFKCFYLKEFLKPKVSIYYNRDYMLGVDYWKRHGTRLEPQLMAKSDLCLSNSVYLTSYCKKSNPNSHMVGQGCDTTAYTSYHGNKRPAELQNIKRPIIGYVGALQTLRLDLDLLIYLAEQRPDWQIVLVGPEDEDFAASKLHQMPNVLFTGNKDADSMPRYIYEFDVCLNPQVINEVTIGNYPRKIDEYLAMGKPVVATHTQGMELFRDHVYLTATKEGYLQMIARALEENTPERQAERVRFAGTHTWENHVHNIYQAVLPFLYPNP